MKYFFIAGERSGDAHASQLIKGIQELDNTALITGWGGSLMAKSGANILQYYSELSVMGFYEVIKKIPFFRRKLAQCKLDIEEFQPEVLILIDFPGFNLRMAKYAKLRGIKVCYYIPPKVWAWKASRLNRLKKFTDKILLILPFEEKYYKEFGVKAYYVGNPSVSQVKEYAFDSDLISKFKNNRKTIAFLPGSREQEIKNAVDIIVRLSEVFEDYSFLVSAVDNVDSSIFTPLRHLRNVKIIKGNTYEIIKASQVAIVTSGTATLETLLLNTPQVVVYKTSPITYYAAKIMVRLKYISLVNLIAGKRVVAELIQEDYNPIDLSSELEKLLSEEDAKKRISEGYSEIRKIIGESNASKNAATHIVELGRS